MAIVLVVDDAQTDRELMVKVITAAGHRALLAADGKEAIALAKSHKPVIVTGDFNTFWGTDEIYLFMRAAGLRSANEKNVPSFPARIPRIELDFVLVSKEIEITHFEVPDVRFSDHRPVLCDFNVRSAVASRTAVA